MNASHSNAARCFVLMIDNRPVCFSSVLHLPNMHANNLKRLHRVVTLPDYQGIGLVHILMGRLGAAYKALGFRLRAYPKHPPFIQTFSRNKEWRMIEKPKIRTNITKRRVKVSASRSSKHCTRDLSFSNRFTGAIFEYIGGSMDRSMAERLISGD